jgi:colicin import membrane protein
MRLAIYILVFLTIGIAFSGKNQGRCTDIFRAASERAKEHLSELDSQLGTSNVKAPRIAKIINGETPPDQDESANPVAVDDYVARIKSVISQKWQPPKGLQEHRVVTSFTILKNGLIVDPSVNESSGNAEIDRSALKALKEASPLEPLPAGAPSSIQIRYVFDWHVTGKKSLYQP